MGAKPFCNPCLSAHEMLKNWILKGIDFKLILVFNPGKKKFIEYEFIYHLFSLKAINTSKATDALNYWFDSEKRELNDWKNKFPIATQGIENISAVLEKQNDWCDYTEIPGTPTFFINGYKLPKGYQLKDLRYILLNWDN